MTAILYGNLRVEITGDAGARVQRLGFSQPAADLLHPSQAETLRDSLMFGRDREIADAFAAVEAERPIGFFGTCGYGKTTLLKNVTAAASERGIASRSLYLRAGGNRIEDLLQDLVAKLFVCEQPVKLTPQECAQVLGQVSAVIAVDDLRASQGQIDYLVRVLPNCRLVIGSARPVLGGRGSSYEMGRLPEDAALSLLADGLGRPLTVAEGAPARRLVAAVDGQPLHLRQCAALVREEGHSLKSLARQATSDPAVLDRLSINSLARHQRRALAVLALAAGTLLPVSVVEAIGQGAYVAEWLASLHRRGLAEQRDDRFGLPVCKAESYRQLLFRDLHLASSARELSDWLISADPLGADSGSAAEAAVTMMEFAGERGEWATVVQLARAAERVLFVAGRWEAWHHVLARGLMAAKASGDQAAHAFFAHQQGTLAFCQDQLGDAYQLLQQALALRTQLGDEAGASLTRGNLRLLELPESPPPPRPRVPRRALRALAGVIATLALTVGTVVLAGWVRSGGPPQPDTSPSPSVSHSTDPDSTSPTNPSSHGSSRPIKTPGSTVTVLHLSPLHLSAATVGVADRQQITASGGARPYSFAVTSGTLPSGLTLSGGGLMSGTPTVAGSYQFTVTVTDSSTTPIGGSAVYTLLVKVPPPTVTLTPATLPVTLVGARQSQQISVAGGTAPYTFTWTGSLPPGLSLLRTGLISGIPSTAGSYQFRVTATDSSATPISGSVVYTLLVKLPPPTVTLTPATLPVMVVGDKQGLQISATGGTAPYAFTWKGDLPPGLSLSSTGLISGAPTTAGSYQFTITAADSAATPDSGSQSYALQVKDPPPTVTLTPGTLPVMTVGDKQGLQISATGGTAPYAFTWKGDLPPGLSLSSTGLISGAPTTKGNYKFTITAADASIPADSGSQTYTLEVQVPTLGLSPSNPGIAGRSAAG